MAYKERGGPPPPGGAPGGLGAGLWGGLFGGYWGPTGPPLTAPSPPQPPIQNNKPPPPPPPGRPAPSLYRTVYLTRLSSQFIGPELTTATNSDRTAANRDECRFTRAIGSSRPSATGATRIAMTPVSPSDNRDLTVMRVASRRRDRCGVCHRAAPGIIRVLRPVVAGISPCRRAVRVLLRHLFEALAATAYK